MKEFCKLIFYRFIALLLSCSMAFGEIFAMEKDAARRLASRAPRSVVLGFGEDARTDTLDAFSGAVLLHESEVDAVALKGTPGAQHLSVYYSQADVASSDIYYSQARSENEGDPTFYAVPVQGTGTAGIPGQVLGVDWDPGLYEQGREEFAGWDPETYDSGEQIQQIQQRPDRRIFTRFIPFGQGNSVTYYEKPDALQPYRQDLMGAEHSKLRMAFFDRALPCSVYFFSAAKRIKEGSFPLSEEGALRRYHRMMGFFQGTADTAVKGAYVACAGLVVYQLVYGAPYSSVLEIFVGGDIRRLYNIADFTGHQALGSVLAFPVINGFLSARSGSRLADNRNYPFERELDLLKESPSTLYNDFWRSSIQRALQNLTNRLLYDGRLTQLEVFRILKEVYSFSKIHGGFSWLNAVGLFYAVANGPSRPHITRRSDLDQRAEALRYLDLTLRNSPDYSFAKFYMRSFLLGGLDLPEDKKGRSLKTTKTERAVGAFLRAVRLSGKLFILQGVIKAVIDLATPHQFFTLTESSTPDASEINNRTSAGPTVPPPTVNGTVTAGTGAPTVPPPTVNGTATAATGAPTVPPPTVNGTATAGTGAPTVPPTVNGTVTAGTGAPTVPPTVNGTVTAGTGAPTVLPTLPVTQDSLLQSRCLQQIVRGWNTFPEEDPSVDVLPRIGRFPALPSQIDVDLSGKGLSEKALVRFFTGFAAAQPNVTIQSVNLGGSFITDNGALQRVLLALPLSLRTLIWELDPVAAPPSPSGGFDFTNLTRFRNMTSLRLIGWNVGNISSLSQAIAGLPQLQDLNVTRIGLGGNSQTSPFITRLFVHPGLQVVDLSYNGLGSNSSDVQTLGRALNVTQTPVRVLRLNNNGIGVGDAAHSLAFLESLGALSSLVELNLRNNPIGTSPSSGVSYALTLARSLERLPKLQKFNLQGAYLSNSSVVDLNELARVIATQLPGLQELYVARPARDAASFPSSFLTPLRAVSSSLNGTDVGSLILPEDVRVFFAGLSPGTRVLDLSQKLGGTSDVLIEVAAQITRFPGNFTEVDLYRNSNFGPTLESIFFQSPFSPTLAPAIGMRSEVEDLSIGLNEILSVTDQTAWVSAIGKLPRLRVLDLSANAFAQYGNLTALGAALNKTFSLETLFVNDNTYLSYAGAGPLDVLGSTFPSLRNLSTLELSHDYIFGLGGSVGGSDLGMFFTRLKTASSLRHLVMSYNFVGKMNVTEGEALAASLRNLRRLEFLDISYNRLLSKLKS